MSLFDKTYIKKPSAAAPSSIEAVSSFDTSQITSNLSGGGAAGIANGDATSAAAAANTALSEKLGSNVAKPSEVKAPIRDPIKAAFASKGSPNANGFITNPIRGTTDDLNIGQDNTSADNLDSVLSKDLMTLAERLGTPTPTNDQELSALQAKAGEVVGAMSRASTFETLPEPGTLLTPPPPISGSTSTSSDAESFARFIGQQVQGRGLLAGVDDSVVGMLAEGFTTGLPALADAAGDAIGNLPVDVSPEVLTLIKDVGATAFSLATDAYCSGATPFANRQNLFNSIVGLTARQGILCALAGFLAETSLMHSSTKSVLRSTMDEVSSKGMASIVDVLADAVGPGTLSNSMGIASNLIRKGVIDEYDVTAIDGALTTLSVDIQGIVQDDFGEGADTVWSVDTIQQADASTLDTLLGSETVKLTDRSTPIQVEGWNPADGWT